MGSGGAVSESIFFIGAIVVSVAFVGIFGTSVSQLSNDANQRGSTLSNELRSDVAIVNDPKAMTTSPLTLFVKNTGEVRLYAPDTLVFLNGQLSENVTLDVLGSTDDEAWRPSNVLKITVNDLSVAAGDHRVRVVAQYGATSELEFNKV